MIAPLAVATFEISGTSSINLTINNSRVPIVAKETSKLTISTEAIIF